MEEPIGETYVTVLWSLRNGKHFPGEILLQIVKCDCDVCVLHMTCQRENVCFYIRRMHRRRAMHIAHLQLP